MSPDAPLCVREEHDDITDAGDKSEGQKWAVPPSFPPPPPAALAVYRPASGKQRSLLISQHSHARLCNYNLFVLAALNPAALG